LPLAALLVVSTAAGCHQSDTTLLDITVQIDPQLQLDQVTIEFQGPHSMLTKTSPVALTGTPPSYPDVRWPLSIDLSSHLDATLTVRGKANNNDVVTLVADVTMSPKQSLNVMLRLSAACQGKPCTDADNQTCVDG